MPIDERDAAEEDDRGRPRREDSSEKSELTELRADRARALTPPDRRSDSRPALASGPSEGGGVDDEKAPAPPAVAAAAADDDDDDEDGGSGDGNSSSPPRDSAEEECDPTLEMLLMVWVLPPLSDSSEALEVAGLKG